MSVSVVMCLCRSWKGVSN